MGKKKASPVQLQDLSLSSSTSSADGLGSTPGGKTCLPASVTSLREEAAGAVVVVVPLRG